MINELELERPNIAGWSFGGFLAANFAISYPERVNKLIMMSPAAIIAPIRPMFYFKLLPALFSGKDEKIDYFLKWISGSNNNDFPNPTFTVFTSGLKNFQGWSMGTKLVVFSKSDFKKITAPILIMIGKDDPIYKKTTPKELADKLNKMQSNISAEIVDGTHGFPIQKAEFVNDKIISFISGK